MKIKCKHCNKEVPCSLTNLYWSLKIIHSKTTRDDISFKQTKMECSDYHLNVADYNNKTEKGLMYSYKFNENQLNEKETHYFCNNECAFYFAEKENCVFYYYDQALNSVRALTPQMKIINKTLGSISNPYRGLHTPLDISSIWLYQFCNLNELLNRAYNYLINKQNHEAIEVYDFILKFAPFPIACNNIATAFVNIGDLHKGIIYYKKAIEYNDTELDVSAVYCSIATCYDKLYQFKESLPNYDKAIALSPNNGKYYAFRGQVKKHLGLFSESEDDFNMAERLGFYSRPSF